jgi:hypothetical protein
MLAFLLASAVLAGCSGSSSDGSHPSPSASVSTGTQIGNAEVLREPMSYVRAKVAMPKLRAMPGVRQVLYDSSTHELLVDLDAHATVKERQSVVVAVAQAANAKS